MVSDKFSVGVRGMYHNGKWESYKETGAGSPGFTSDFDFGRNYNFGINASYYVLNSNKISDKKHAVHVDLVVGHMGYGMNNTVTSLRETTCPAYYKYTNYFGANCLGLTPGLGYELTARNGKVFFDIAIPIEICGNEFTNYSDQVWGSSFNGVGTSQAGGYLLFNTNVKGSRKFDPLFFANLGCQIYF